MTTQATSALQMARECIAATINQDDTLTVQEAREHASQALTHMEQAEEAFDAMREALEDFVAACHERTYGDVLHTKEEAQTFKAYKKAVAALALAKGEQ